MRRIQMFTRPPFHGIHHISQDHESGMHGMSEVGAVRTQTAGRINRVYAAKRHHHNNYTKIRPLCDVGHHVAIRPKGS